MKKLLPLVAAAVALGFAVASIPGFAQNGNGITSNGAHYNLNLIGVTDGKKPTLTNTDRHTIFVPLDTANDDPVPGTDIWLTQGPFAVCDGNAFDAAYDCNGTQIAKLGAVFQLPCNTNITAANGTTLVPCTTGQTASYDVWARVVGTPGGSSTLTTCATDPLGALVCSTNKQTFVRMKPNKFTNVTDALTSLVDQNTLQTVALFQGGFQNFFWDYDNNGNKLVQLRFYLN
jgi:hypothetical protein